MVYQCWQNVHTERYHDITTMAAWCKRRVYLPDPVDHQGKCSRPQKDVLWRQPGIRPRRYPTKTSTQTTHTNNSRVIYQGNVCTVLDTPPISQS